MCVNRKIKPKDKIKQVDWLVYNIKNNFHQPNISGGFEFCLSICVNDMLVITVTCIKQSYPVMIKRLFRHTMYIVCYIVNHYINYYIH